MINYYLKQNVDLYKAEVGKQRRIKVEGKIMWYSQFRGAGYIKGDDGQELCFLSGNIEDDGGDTELLENERVSYKPAFISGNLVAINVRRMKSEPKIGNPLSYLTEGISSDMRGYDLFRKMLKNVKQVPLYEEIYNDRFKIPGESLEECTVKELRILLFQGIQLKDNIISDDLDSIEMLLKEEYSVSDFKYFNSMPEYNTGIVNIPTLFKILCVVHKQYNSDADYTDKNTSIGLFLKLIDDMKWRFLESDYDNTGNYLNNSMLTHYFWIAVKNMLEVYAKCYMKGKYVPRVAYDTNFDNISTKDLNNKEKMLLEFILGADKIYCDSIEKSSRFVRDLRNDPHNPHPSVFIHYELPRIYADITCAYRKDPGFLRMDDLLNSLMQKYEVGEDFISLQLFIFPMLYAYKNCQTIIERDSWIDEQYSQNRTKLIDKHNSSLIGYEDTEGLPFGIITNSILGATLYFAQDSFSRYSQIKSAQNKARKEYEENERKLSSEYHALSWKTGIKKLDIYYDLLKKNVLLASQLVAEQFEIDYGKIFKIYQDYIKSKQEEEEKQFQEELRKRQEKKRVLADEINQKKRELEELEDKHNSIGLVLWGEKAKLKKSLYESIVCLKAEIERMQRKHDTL